MNLRANLETIVRRQFDWAGVEFDSSRNLTDIATSYFQALTRVVIPVPRMVQFSDEVHISLGVLIRENDQVIRNEAREAWKAAFHLYRLFSEGRNVNPYLSKLILTAKGKKSNDGLLFDYGMHHLHLNSTVEQDGFIMRSRYLLFAVVAKEDVYFVDIREHPKGSDLGWVRQDLVAIVNSNWPELLDARALRGVLGDTITDEQKQEIRRKNANHLSPVEGKVFMPLGGGTMNDGSSLRCRQEAIRLVHEIDEHQRILENLSAELKDAFKKNGIVIGTSLELDLVQLDGLDLSPETLAALNAENCLSSTLSKLGFVVVEQTTKSPIVVGV